MPKPVVTSEMAITGVLKAVLMKHGKRMTITGEEVVVAGLNYTLKAEQHEGGLDVWLEPSPTD